MVYKLPAYVPGIAFAVALVAALVGALLLWKRKPLILALLAFGFAAFVGGVIAPMLAMDRVVFDDQKLEQTTGFWFAPNVKGFRLADATSVTITTKPDRNNRQREVWVVRMKNGETREIDPGDNWEMHGPDIVRRLRDKGIEVRQ